MTMPTEAPDPEDVGAAPEGALAAAVSGPTDAAAQDGADGARRAGDDLAPALAEDDGAAPTVEAGGEGGIDFAATAEDDAHDAAGGESTDDPGGESAEAPPPPAADRAPYVLPARMRVAEAEALLAWLRAVAPGEAVAFDASGVESLSTPGVLALAAAARACAAAGHPAAVDRPAPAFVDAFSDLGLFQDLMKMEFRP